LGLNCQFFTLESIEFDLDQCDVRDQVDLSRLLEFMGGIGERLGKLVRLTWESCPDKPILVFEPDDGQTRYVPPQY
jgi:hypothetical protein